MISIFVFVRRPIPRQSSAVIEDAEGSITGEIRSPKDDPSVFECQVGDIVILDGEEQLVVREGKDRDISAFCVMHRKKDKTGEDTA